MRVTPLSGKDWTEGPISEETKSRLDKSLTATTGKPESSGDLNVNVHAPRGTSTEVETGGMFNKSTVKRTMSKDEPEDKKSDGDQPATQPE